MISFVNMKELVLTVGVMYGNLSKYEGIGLASRVNV